MTRLNLSGNCLGLLSGKFFVKLIHKFPFLAKLNLSNNELDDRKIHVVTRACLRLHRLSSLNLTNNNFTINILPSLEKFITNNQSITKIKLQPRNHLSPSIQTIEESIKPLLMLNAYRSPWIETLVTKLLDPDCVSVKSRHLENKIDCIS